MDGHGHDGRKSTTPVGVGRYIGAVKGVINDPLAATEGPGWVLAPRRGAGRFGDLTGGGRGARPPATGWQPSGLKADDLCWAISIQKRLDYQACVRRRYATQGAVWVLMRGLKPTPIIGRSLRDQGCLQHPEPKCFHVPVRQNFERRPMLAFPPRDCFKPELRN